MLVNYNPACANTITKSRLFTINLIIIVEGEKFLGVILAYAKENIRISLSQMFKSTLNLAP